MADPKNYGSKRRVVGAHYGVMDFIIQRVTAVIMAVYTVILFVGFLCVSGTGFESWRSLFLFNVYVFPLGRLLASLAFISLAWHAWIGVRDIWMDYIKSVGLRLTLQVLTVLWLLATVIYFAIILWSV